MELNNATIIKKANIYFEGSVTSRTVIKDNNERVTLGVMLPGKYEFSTNEKEIMEVLNGRVEVTLANATKATTYNTNESFTIEANSSFKINVLEVFDYLCSYLEE